MSAKIHLDDVSVRFRLYKGQSSALKEAAMRWLTRPKWYGTHAPSTNEFWGLKNINLDIKEGDRLGIIGHNGAGKTTLLKVISRIYRPTKGAIDVQGRIAPLIEIGAGFNQELSGRENIFLNGAVLGIPKKVIQERLPHIIEFAELQDFIDVPVKYYSTGMHLRLGFTIATEIAPDILILDELYAGGDAHFIEKASQRLHKFIEKSKILILVAHHLEYVKQFCNKAIVLDHGQLRFCGDPDLAVEKYLAHTSGDAKAFV